MTATLNRCPFCGEFPYPIRDMLVDQKCTGRTLECKCNVFLHRHQCWVDDAHTRLETLDELDADLVRRWNARAPVAQGEIPVISDESLRNKLRNALNDLRGHPYHLADEVLKVVKPYLREPKRELVDRTQRRVVCAAIKKNNVLITGPRHFDAVMHTTINQMIDGMADHLGDAKQGFVDQKGIFMDREEAFLVATAAGQIRQKTGNPNSKELFSEDLY
jgi:hypothetical protein